LRQAWSSACESSGKAPRARGCQPAASGPFEHLPHQVIDQRRLDRQRLPGRRGQRGDRALNGRPQLDLVHRGHQVAVLHGEGQLREIRAARVEIGADNDHHEGRSGRARRAERGDELPPQAVISALREYLLKLVDDQEYASLASPVRRSVPERDLPGRKGKARRVVGKAPAQRHGVGPEQSRGLQGKLLKRVPGRGEHHARPLSSPGCGRQARPADARQHTRTQQRRFPCAGNPRNDQHTGLLRGRAQSDEDFSGRHLPPVKERDVPLTEGTQPPVRRHDHPGAVNERRPESPRQSRSACHQRPVHRRQSN
jgi:hypothetical protein